MRLSDSILSKLIYLIVFSLFCNHLIAQEHHLDWVNYLEGNTASFNTKLTTDLDGNIITLGLYNSTVDFDPGPDTMNLSGISPKNPFISKLDSDGQFIWVKEIESSFHCYGQAVVTDGQGNIYVLGGFYWTQDFDPSGNVYNLTSEGINDIFILKLDSNGEFLWAKQFGGSDWDMGVSIDVDNNGNVYATGYFRDEVDFDPGVGTHILDGGNDDDIFILKLNTNGDFVWVKTYGDIGNSSGYSIHVDDNGYIYNTGKFSGVVDFDSGSGVYNLSSQLTDSYVLKLDSAGNFEWVNQIGNSTMQSGSSSVLSLNITTDTYGNVYTSGVFNGDVDFNPDVDTFIMESISYTDNYIHKLNSTGQFVWAKQIEGPSLQVNREYLRLNLDESGNLYTMGGFNDTVDFDFGLGEFNLISNGSRDLYVLKLDTAGDFSWVKQVSSTVNLVDYGICLDLNDDLVISGGFGDSNTVSFYLGSDTATITTVGNVNTNNAFLLKLQSCLTTSIDEIESCEPYTWIDGNTYLTSNNTATYTLTNIAGCDSIVTLNLNILDVEDVSVSIEDSTISANYTSATSYTWLDCDNNYSVIPSQTSHSFTPSFNGTYAVEITDNGCVDTSACITVNTIGIVESTFVNDLSIYPNPTQGEVKIDFGKAQSLVNVKIISVLGQTVANKTFKETSVLNLELNLPNGMYLLELVNQDEERAVIHVIKE